MIASRSDALPFRSVVVYFVIAAGIILAACSEDFAPTPPDPQHLSTLDTTGQVHIEFGIPRDSNDADDFILIRRQYVVSYNRDLNAPNWVCWNLNADWFGPVPRYSGNFLADTALPDEFELVQHVTYSNSGYDRGHLVRSEERTLTENDNKATFYLTNIIPQRPKLNREVWYDLEKWCEDRCKLDNKELYIIAGGIYHEPHERVGGVVAVPDSCFKIIVVLERGQGFEDVTVTTEIVAVVMPNAEDLDTSSWTIYRTSVDRIEQSTGYDFLYAVENDIELIIESKNP